MNAVRIRRFQSFFGLCLLGVLLAGCHKKNPDKKSAKPAAEERATLKTPQDSGENLSLEIEKLTGGAAAKIVWEQSQNPRDPDTFSTGDEQILKGFDTRDGLGERTILQEKGNYTRPLLTTDGQTILFTRRSADRKNNLWEVRGEIFRTDWKGAAPVKVAEGSAVDCWRDPSTQVEWVYAVQAWDPSKKTTSDPGRLVRFPLTEPGKLEMIYDETRLDSDNIQFSRDGRRASGGFPWPNAGILVLDGATASAKKLRNGCWPSYAPDNSHVSWVFDGSHRSAVFYADDGAKSWEVKLSPPDAGRREMYHPRWSNHPRFLAITGPYKSSRSHNAITGGGGRSAEVYLGRFNAGLNSVEAWVKITDNDLGDNYPDLWIDGGDKAQLAGFGSSLPLASKPTEPAKAWPAKMDGIQFLWRNNSAQNTWRTSDGRNHTADIESHGAARFGRRFEMLLGGGHVELQKTAAHGAAQSLRDRPSVTFEALVLPDTPSGDGHPPASARSTLFRGPDFSVGLMDGRLMLGRDSGKFWSSSSPIPGKPFHLVVIRNADSFVALVDGAPVELKAQDTAKGETSEQEISFGGGWSGGLMNIAIYDRALGPDEVVKNSAAVLREAGRLSSAPPQVKLLGKLVESSVPPELEEIRPYSGSLVALVYEVEQVLSGDFKDKRILVKHWGLLNKCPVAGFPREVGRSYPLTVEKETDHPEIKGERVADETTELDLEPWFDVTQPGVVTQR